METARRPRYEPRNHLPPPVVRELAVWALALAAAAAVVRVSPFALAQADAGRHGGDVTRARDLAILSLIHI